MVVNTVSQIKKKLEGILHPYLEKEGALLSKNARLFVLETLIILKKN